MPARGESQSNGAAEEAGKTVREFTRVLRMQTEDKAKVKLGPDDVITLWMVRWAAMLCSRYLTGKDGLTGYERRRGRKCKDKITVFGEKVWFKRTREGKDRMNQFDTEWEEGVWLGRCRNSNESVIGTRRGTVRAYTTKRQDEDNRWSAEWIQAIRGTPQQPDPNKPGMSIPIRINFDPPIREPADEAQEARKDKSTRRMRITNEMLQEFGYTDGCEGCRRKKAKMTEQRPHSEMCRKLLWERMGQTEEGRRKRDEEEEKMNMKIEDFSRKMVGEKRHVRGETEEEKEDDSRSRSRRRIQEDVVEDKDADMRTSTKRDEPEGDEGRDEGGDRSKMRRVDDEIEKTDEDGDLIMKLCRLSEKIEVELMEMYSPPRVTFEAKNWGLRPGEAMDLLNGWDFRREDHRRAAWKYIDEHKPRLIIGSPMCTVFSQLQNETPWTEGKRARWREAKRHMEFMVAVYRRQLREGRWFLHEQPAAATSWGVEEVEKLLAEEGVMTVIGDQCMHGRAMLARKRTRFMTNSHAIAAELGRNCDRSRGHQHWVSGRVARAARYPQGLCRAICRGLRKELEWSRRDVKCLMRVDAHTEKPTENEHEDQEVPSQAWDDLTGSELDPREVRRARMKEIGYVRNKGVWVKITREEAKRRKLKVLKTRWIDINKGDQDNIDVRSRFVAKEFNTGEEAGLFAATPPLEALRFLISRAATGKHEDSVVMINDVARAFFEAPIQRDVCIELPDEDLEEDDKGQNLVGLLKMSLYGTRDAAANFQREVATVMSKLGFQQGKYNPCTFWHPKRQLRTLVHGDDFVTQGRREDVGWLRSKLEERFEIKTKTVGLGSGEEKEQRILNRVIRVGEKGWEYEPDQRHADLIVRALDLQSAKGVKTPYEEEKEWRREEEEEELTDQEAREFRRVAARANYLALDRPDIQYAAKEVCRGMARPRKRDRRRLKRLARYLIDHPRAVLEYNWQPELDTLEGFSDADWAGCGRTCRSTSGGAVMLGDHCLKTWSSTQKSIALSSGESELIAAVKMSVEIIGMIQMLRDWGLALEGKVLTDSSAALAVVRRRGNGRLRHVKVGVMWIQQKETSGEIAYDKVHGEKNPSDLMTKGLGTKLLEAHMRRLGLQVREGRAEKSLKVPA